jgi:ribosomal-protein-alanine N-acetyltransferase
MAHQKKQLKDSRIQTARVWLMPWRPADSVALRPIAQDVRVMRFITGGKAWSDDQVREFIARQMRFEARYGFCMWSLRRRPDGRLIGLCGMQPLTLGGRREIEIGWWLAVNCWGRGLATEAARAVMSAASRRYGLRRVVAVAMQENWASRGVMRNIGMDYERESKRRGFEVVVYSTRGWTGINRQGKTGGRKVSRLKSRSSR